MLDPMSEGDRLDGRVAIVTGGARGIGEAIVRALVARGAKVVVADTGVTVDGSDPDPSLAQEVAGKLGANAVAYTEDMGIPKAAAGAVALAIEKFGGLDIVVNDAAIQRDAFLFKGNTDHWDAVVRNNLSSAYYLLAAAAPVLRENAVARRGAEEGEGGTYGWGRIVNIVSTAAFYGNYGQAPYASSKAGLVGLSRIAALDMARAGVTSNAVAPLARTRMIERIKPMNEAQATYKERMLKVPASHVGNFVAYLCSPLAANVTGQLFGVRGREVILFTQPRPAKTIVAAGAEWDVDTLGRQVSAELSGSFTDLDTDVDAFASEPIV
jgi:NAD(P)-dependent dehydrogenase (short-subunit alcohol dehydrogenase family)